jgi:hypothetical protein
MPGSSDSGTSGQVPEARRPPTWPTSHTSPPTTTTTATASSGRVSLACRCWSCAQARHWHSGRSGRITRSFRTGHLVGASKRLAVANESSALLLFCSCSQNRNRGPRAIPSR